MILPTDKLTWRKAEKVKPIRAKHLSGLLHDPTILSKILIDTLEGREPLHECSIICLGEAGDVWQQAAKSLLKKYHIVDFDDWGWMICQPQKGNLVEVYEVTQLEAGTSYIIGTYGETLEDGTLNAQRVSVGDFICRDPQNVSDQWVVAKKIFQNTYEIKL